MDVINFQNSEIRKIIRPITARPKTAKNYMAIESNYKPKESVRESEGSSSHKEKITITTNSKYEHEESEYSQKEKDSNMDFVFSEEEFLQQKTEIEKIINQENILSEFINKQRENMKNINLIEKNVEGIYEWKSLFNKSRPISAYTHSHKNYKHTGEEEEKVTTKNLHTNSTIKNELNLTNKIKTEAIFNTEKEKSNPFIFPIALINEREEKIKDFITFNKNNNNKINKRKKINKEEGNFKKYFVINKDKIKSVNNDNSQKARSQRSSYKSEIDGNRSHLRMSNNSLSKTNIKKPVRTPNATRPQSVYAKRKDNEIFYLNQAFSDYFTQDLSEFAAKFPLLHPKIRCNSNRLNKTLHSVIIKEREDDKLLETKRKEENVLITEKELNLAGNSKNIVPLLKSIYTQMYPSEETNTTTSILNRDTKEVTLIKKKNNYSNTKNKKNNYNSANSEFSMKTETYNIDDPEIKMFMNEDDKNKNKNEPNLSNLEIQNVDEDSKLLKETHVGLIECFIQPDINKEALDEDLDKTNERNFIRRPQTCIERFEIPTYLRPKSNIYRIQSANGKLRNLRFHENIPQMDEDFLNQLNEKKTHKLNLLSYSHLPENTSTIVPYPSRTLPFKDKPGYQPFQYSNLKNILFTNKRSKESMTNRGIQVDRNNQGMNLKISYDQQTNEKENIIQRPNTSLINRPNNMLAHRTRTTRNPSHNFELLRPKSKRNRVNYVNFNDYIDIQFRDMNPNSRFHNSYKKEEMPYFTKTFITNNKHIPDYDFNDTMKITNFKLEKRKVTSAKVKLLNQ